MIFSALKYVLAITLTIFFFVSISLPIVSHAQEKNLSPAHKKIAELEAASGGRIGVSAVNTGNDMRIQYRAHERFATMCTAKVIGVAAILKKSMSDPTLLQQKVTYSKKDLTNWTPITEKHLADGMTVAELGAAAISYSDNTAMNLLLEKLGGPQGMTAFARSIHDQAFRQDHGWPEEAMSGAPGDSNDSSTPAAMEKSLQQLALGHVLAQPQRELLLTWLKNNTTGNERIRAGVPKSWTVGDKTGTGFFYGTTNDIGIIWPPHCAPIVVAIFYNNNNKDAPKRNDVIAETTHILLEEFARTDSCIKL